MVVSATSGSRKTQLVARGVNVFLLECAGRLSAMAEKEGIGLTRPTPIPAYGVNSMRPPHPLFMESGLDAGRKTVIYPR